MAESAVSFLVNQLVILLRQEQELFKWIGKDAVYIRDELEQMRAFLRTADAREGSDVLLKEWVKQVREITHDTEDVLAMYMLRFAYQRYGTSGLKRYIKNMYATVKNLRARHRIASEFHEIRLRLENVSKSRERFRDVHNDLNESLNDNMYDTRGVKFIREEENVVGIEEPKKQLLDWLMQSDDGLKVISVVGMGGSGKTTLVKKIYNDVKANFNSHVWITVSQNFNLEHFSRDIINNLANENIPPPQNLEAMNGNQMIDYVKEFLKDKTYIIILDDVWTVNAWESIRYIFQRASARSRIIITTRSTSVGEAACNGTNGHLYHLEHLTPEKSEELFYSLTFPQSSCPQDLKESAKNILRRCEGLPLAIVVIGRLLLRYNNNHEKWLMFAHTINLELQEDHSLGRLNRLLSHSYYDLPYYLKACFLYLSIFPEDELLLKWKIIRLWIAEGFVQTRDGKTQEEVAESYLDELLNRSLIQVADTYLDGRPRKFRIHDILRECIISKALEQNLLTLSCGEEMTCKVRRMAIHNTLNNTKECYNVKYLRSFFWLESVDSESGLIMFRKVLGGQCRLLKVLDIRGSPIDSIPTEVFELYYLKYLSLRRTNVQLIPKSIRNLQNLETLDLKKPKVTKLPVEILKLHKLRHLLVYTCICPHTFHPIKGTLKAPYAIGCNLTSLQKLCYIDADEAAGIKIVREIGKLTQLRRLGITKLRTEGGKDLCSSLGKLTKLRTLYIYSNGEDVVLDLDHSLSSPPLSFLRKIVLRGRLEKFPQWVYSLDGLTDLNLSWSRLREDPLRHLGVLPNLVSLQMRTLSYEGEELIFKDTEFQKLKRLVLEGLRGLRCVRVEKGSMPHLVELCLWCCGQMEKLPEGIKHLSNLQEMNLDNWVLRLGLLTQLCEKIKKLAAAKFQAAGAIAEFHATVASNAVVFARTRRRDIVDVNGAVPNADADAFTVAATSVAAVAEAVADAVADAVAAATAVDVAAITAAIRAVAAAFAAAAVNITAVDAAYTAYIDDASAAASAAGTAVVAVAIPVPVFVPIVDAATAAAITATVAAYPDTSAGAYPNAIAAAVFAAVTDDANTAAVAANTALDTAVAALTAEADVADAIDTPPSPPSAVPSKISTVAAKSSNKSRRRQRPPNPARNPINEIQTCRRPHSH